jgi:low affinity Fe/Cu permease
MAEQRERTLFDDLASRVGGVVARAPFFALCATFVLGWLIALPFVGWKSELAHLLLNSPTTAITFLLVALLQNSSARFENSVNIKLNALAGAVGDLMDAMAETLDTDDCDALRDDAHQLRDAVGTEDEVGA